MRAVRARGHPDTWVTFFSSPTTGSGRDTVLLICRKSSPYRGTRPPPTPPGNERRCSEAPPGPPRARPPVPPVAGRPIPILPGMIGGMNAPRILLVDDDPNLLVILADQLRA